MFAIWRPSEFISSPLALLPLKMCFWCCSRRVTKETRKKSISRIIYSNLFTFTCGKASRSGHGKCCSSGSWTWGTVFDLITQFFLGCIKGKPFLQKGCIKQKLFQKGVHQGQNFVKDRGASRTKLSSKISNPQ